MHKGVRIDGEGVRVDGECVRDGRCEGMRVKV